MKIKFKPELLAFTAYVTVIAVALMSIPYVVDKVQHPEKTLYVPTSLVCVDQLGTVALRDVTSRHRFTDEGVVRAEDDKGNKFLIVVSAGWGCRISEGKKK